MEQTESENIVPSRTPMHWPSNLALAGGLILILLFLGGAGLFLLGGMLSFLSPVQMPGEAASMFSYAAASLLAVVLLLPMVVMAVKRLSGKPVRPAGFLQAPGSLRWLRWALWLFPLTLGLGAALNTIPDLDWLFMPGITVLALSLPVAAVLWLGTKSLPPSSPQRNWTVFGMSLTLTPIIIIVIELVLAVAGLVAVGVVLTAFMPDLVAEIEYLVKLFRNTLPGQVPDEQALIDLVTNPWVTGGLLFFTAGVVPLLEEALKPLAVWLRAGRELSLQDGWVLGLLTGAGFALVENLGNQTTGEGWVFLILARFGATVLHMFNSAIIGYTFVLARQRKRPRVAILAFLGALAVHAIWNAAAILATVAGLKDPESAVLGWPLSVIVMMVSAVAAMLAAIHRMDRKLARETGLEKPESESITT
jgi:RsiW-degrading membrane proteinase PrsW (M82 family)